jgi:tetratricopeptide (TPR) repeat protein
MRQKNRHLILFVCFWIASAVDYRVQAQSPQDAVAPIIAAMRSQDYPRALSLTRSALAKRPGDYRVWTLQGMAFSGMGRLPRALTAYQQALKFAPNYLPALEGAAQTEFHLDSNAAVPLLLKILGQQPNDATSHALLGVLEFKKKDCTAAVDHFQKAGGIIDGQAGVLNEFGVCLANLNRIDEAVAIFKKVLALDSTKREARYNLALAQWNAHDADTALATLKPLTDATSIDPDASLLVADILESKGDTAHSIELLRSTILADPKNAGAYLQFAALTFDHASPQVGIDILNAGLSQLPKEPRLYFVRGALLTQLGEFTRAAGDFEMANKIDPHLQFLGVAEGLVESQQHLSAEALAKFRAAVKAHPEEAYSQYLLAEALMEEEKPEGSPEYKEEVVAATRAVQLDPSLVAAHDLLSAVYIESGNVEGAIQQSRAALSFDQDDQQAIYHLIVALRKTKEKDQIPSLLKRLVELRANEKTKQSADKKYRLSEIPSSISTSGP